MANLDPGALVAEETTWVDAAAGVASIVTAVTLVVGGAFSYFRFLRGRVFRIRCALEMQGTLHAMPGTDAAAYIHLRVTNAGASELVFAADPGSYIRAHALTQAMLTDARNNGDDVIWDGAPAMEATLFSPAMDEARLESGESRVTTAVFALPPDALGFQARAQLVGRRSRWVLRSQKATWASEVVVIPNGGVR